MHITRKLRKTSTPWERKLWNILRSRQLKNYKFRRQFKIGEYVVDFYSPQARLIIELDGGQHNQKPHIKKDLLRQRKLEQSGNKVIRFWNNDIDENLEGVVLTIKQYL